MPRSEEKPAGRRLFELDDATGIGVIEISGELVQTDRRDRVIDRPVTPEVARVVGMTNLVVGTVTAEHRGDFTVVEVDAQHRVSARTLLPEGTSVWIGIRPEHLKLDVGRGDVDPIGDGVVREIVNDGVSVTVQVEWAGSRLRTHLLAGRGLARTLVVGAPVSLSASPEHIHLIRVDPD